MLQRSYKHFSVPPCKEMPLLQMHISACSHNGVTYQFPLMLKEKKKRRQCKHHRYGLGKDVVLCSTPPNGCRDTQAQHPIQRTKKERLFSGDQVVGRQKPAHHQKYCLDILGVVFNASPHLYGFCCGSDCMQAYVFHDCGGVQTSNFEDVEGVPCMAAVDGACCSQQNGVKGFTVSE